MKDASVRTIRMRLKNALARSHHLHSLHVRKYGQATSSCVTCQRFWAEQQGYEFALACLKRFSKDTPPDQSA